MIYIVDDDRSVRTSLTRLMRSAGYEALAFADAEEYLHVVTGAAAADCVILDLHMPGMNGLELQQVINRREPPVPVIVLTACEDADLRTKAVTAGAAKVLRKPCDSAVLLHAVADAIGQSPPPFPRLAASTLGTTHRPEEVESSEVASGDPDGFAVEGKHAVYRAVGAVSFDKAVEMVRAAIASARRIQVRDLLVDTTALTGFPSPDTLERFLTVVDWAQESRGGLRLALVAREELIHPQKFGVLVAFNQGLISNIFPTEQEARAWLTA
jgi:CheY-like chemotaxis protein